MFSRGKFTDEETAPPSRMATGGRNTTFSIIGSDVVITGNIAASVDLHVDGQVEGDLTCAALVQGEGSRIMGAITAESARLAGRVEGSINAKLLVVERSARITGDVSYDNLTIEPGAQVDGRFTQRDKATDLHLVTDNMDHSIAR